MFNNLIKSAAFFLLIHILGSCSPKIGRYDTLMDGIVAKPEVLQLHRDSVRVTVQGAIPLSLLNQDSKIYLYPEYIYGEGSLRLGEIIPFDGAYTKNLVEAKVAETIVFPYLPGMEQGELVIKGVVERKKGVFQAPNKVIATGLEITPLLTRYGQVLSDQPIPDIGIYMTKIFQDMNQTETRDFYIPFEMGSGQKQNPVFQVSFTDYLIKGEPGMKINKVVVTGLSSPESKDNIIGLAKKRSDFISERLKANRSLRNTPVESMYRSGDWFDLRQLLTDYEGITQEQKEEVYTILLNGNSFASQLASLQKLPGYRNISRDLFPMLRSAKVSFELENTRLNDVEISAGVFALLKDQKPLEGFGEEHLTYAAQNALKLDEKEAIYKKLAELYPSEHAFNNLGVVYLNMAQRELDVRKRNILITDAISNLTQANKIKASSITLHNLGRAYLLREDYFEAYIAISEASALEKEETNEFLNYNEGLRGALDILNGDYKLATIRFNRTMENESNFFNKGLAYFLSEDYLAASENFEAAVQADRETGYGFYGIALVAAANGDKEALMENLGKAVERSEFLKEKALKDINFKNYRNEQEFINLFR
ncbi:TPR end-of-group domain-containing protein [Cognataquiflexum rubidum]|uniref:TPR end-of-group domain-containing protein n=1 Tax=Cognataquiflexum rubidum TaxID=2922273 RepID=UPI001F147026|nr:tetratricopeptide repeat protein [Cognataquiflexum rubidum]MCH6233253.1 tetratricopeptide repeat protein [Cognataquiflexum rubidum]